MDDYTNTWKGFSFDRVWGPETTQVRQSVRSPVCQSVRWTSADTLTRSTTYIPTTTCNSTCGRYNMKF